MMRIVLAAAAAFALSSATPALAGGCPDCKDCPMGKMAAADKAEKKGVAEEKAVACPCGDGKECKCGAQCQCPHCSAKKAQKDESKKS